MKDVKSIWQRWFVDIVIGAHTIYWLWEGSLANVSSINGNITVRCKI